MSTTIPVTEAQRASRYGLLLAEIADAAYSASPSGYSDQRIKQIRDLLHHAGIHASEVDDDGQPVTPPHSDCCRQCDPPGAEPYPLAEAAGSGRDGDGHSPLPTAFCPACDGRPASATCSTCGGRLVWRFGTPDTRTATPRGAYEHAEVTR